MGEEFRLKIEGAPTRWVTAAGSDGWLTQALVDLWREAVASEGVGSKKCLVEAIRLADEIGFGSTYKRLSMPRPKEEAARRRASMLKTRQETLDVLKSDDWRYEAATLISSIKDAPDLGGGEEQASLRELLFGFEKKKAKLTSDEENLCLFEPVNSRVLDIPSVRVGSRIGEAVLFDAERASALIARAKKVNALSGLVPKANGEAGALGFPVKPWLDPGRAPTGTREFASAIAERFCSKAEFDGRDCFAIYVEPEGDASSYGKGFMARGGGLLPDLAEASLFPSKAAAKKAGERHLSDAFLVSVRASVVNYEPIRGTRASKDLAPVVAAREARDIERSLAAAEIEDLRAELARRETALGLGESRQKAPRL